MNSTQAAKRRLCRTCGTDIAAHARYTRWTECSVCYWRGRYERCESIQDLERKQTQLEQRLTELTPALSEAEKACDDYAARLQANTPWFKRIFGPATDSTLEGYKQQSRELLWEESRVRSALGLIPYSIERARSTRKRLTEAQLAHDTAERHKQQEQQQQAEFAENSASALSSTFDRALFCIQSKDYRRGNAVDNYCRTTLANAIIASFDRSCAFCGSSEDLTFDHYGITKNEGGNFVLIATDRQSLRVNLVVLCRTCNSMKAQRRHHHFFDKQHLEGILACQERLLATILTDERFMKMLKKWSKEIPA